MTLPLITVGLITYNAENSLSNVIDCITGQTWKNWECVIVDDVSKDGTWDFLIRLSEKDSRFRIFKNPDNRGAGYSRSRIVEEARGEFICFFDDDDISHLKRLEKQFDLIQSYENKYKPEVPVISHVSRQVMDEAGKIWDVKAFGCTNGIAPSGEEVADYILFGELPSSGTGSIGTGVQMARTQAYKQAGNFDPLFRRCQDTELAVRWALMGSHFIGSEEILMFQSIKLNSRKIDMEKKYALLQLEKHREYLESKNVFTFIYPWTKAKYAYWEGNNLLFLSLLSQAFVSHPVRSFKRLVSAFSGAWYTLLLRSKYKSTIKTSQ